MTRYIIRAYRSRMNQFKCSRVTVESLGPGVLYKPGTSWDAHDGWTGMPRSSVSRAAARDLRAH